MPSQALNPPPGFVYSFGYVAMKTSTAEEELQDI